MLDFLSDCNLRLSCSVLNITFNENLAHTANRELSDGDRRWGKKKNIIKS